MKTRNSTYRVALAAIAILVFPMMAWAGPETALREFASSQIKKGVRSIGMGGDGATWGNYSLVYRDEGTAIVDYGSVNFSDTGNQFTFTAVGFTTPKFWDNAALYVVGMSQHAVNVKTWTETAASSSKPPSIGDGSNQAVFIKFAKPITEHWSAGLMLPYELSQMSLDPFDGSHSIRYQTAWRPSIGAGLSWQPETWFLAGVRVILNNDEETRIDGSGTKEGLLRSYEYRAGVSMLPWEGGLLDVGVSMLDRSSGLEGTSTFAVNPTLGIEQAIVARKYWLRAGLDETSFTAGGTMKWNSFKIDLAYLNNIAAVRTGDTFGRRSSSEFLTMTYEYE